MSMTNFDTLINKPHFLNSFTILSFLTTLKNKKGGIYILPPLFANSLDRRSD
jgi:hypothetical protein